MDRTIADLEEDFINLGAAAFRAQYRHPVLVRKDSDAADEGVGFRTEFMSRETLSAMDSGERPPASAAKTPGQVHSIFKPAGKPFQERIGVGRAPNADVSVRLPRVSKYHGFFTRSDDGSFLFTDAGSKNGTTIDGERLEARQAHAIAGGNSIHLGPYHFIFYLPEALHDLIERRVRLR